MARRKSNSSSFIRGNHFRGQPRLPLTPAGEFWLKIFILLHQQKQQLKSISLPKVPQLPQLPNLPKFSKPVKPKASILKKKSKTIYKKTTAFSTQFKFPTFKLSAPQVSLPTITLPQISLPKFSLPQLTIPSFSLPLWRFQGELTSHQSLVRPEHKRHVTLYEAPHSSLWQTAVAAIKETNWKQLFADIAGELKELITPAKQLRVKKMKPRKPLNKVLRSLQRKLNLQLAETKSHVVALTDIRSQRQAFKNWAFSLPQYLPHTIAAFILAGLIMAGFYHAYVFVFKDLPSANELVEREQFVTTRILDRNGELLFRIYEDENRTLIKLEELHSYTKQATIAIEDQNFYQHQGFDVVGIVRAATANAQGKSIQGGSTITQQLVKNRLLTSERTLQRKIREVLLAIMVDNTYEKDEILQMYFNTVAYGGATYGIEEAAQTYFGKSASQLTLAESAMLAGLPAAPSVYSPFGTHPELAYQRQEEVLRRMVEEEYITQEQADAARQEEIHFRPNVINIKAPHFVMYVKQLLAEQYGEDVVNQGGLEVITSLDLELQNKTQELVTKEVAELARMRVSNGAALVTNPQTGEVLAMVGSKDYFDFEHDGQVNVTLRPRQPGSSIKPLTYAVGLERGKTPYTIIDDSPVVYHTPGSKPYAPKNYDGKFHGRVTLRQALASSYNIPAVKMLAEVGINTVIDKGTAMGISTWIDRTRFGLSLTLGGGEVLMTDMAEVYGTFANYGYTVDLNPILEIRDSKGQVLYYNYCALEKINCTRKKNLDPLVAYQITDMLSDNVARTPAFGSQSVLHIPNQQVAVKTGTTNNLRDNWTFGYTQDRLVAVWVGNNDNTPMSYVASGVTGASPIWNNIMRLMLDDANPHRFSTPEGLVKVSICAQTGTLTCASCPTTQDAFFVPGTEPKQACTPASFKPKSSPRPGSTTRPQNRDRILDGAGI